LFCLEELGYPKERGIKVEDSLRGEVQKVEVSLII